MSYNPQNPNGQASSANSAPVVVASDQSALPISAASLPLPADASTATHQTDGSQKSQIVDGSGNVIGSTSNALNVNITSSSVNGSTNITQIDGAAAVTAGVNGTLATGGNQAAGNNISTNTNPLLVGGSDYGGTAKLQTLKVDSSGNAQVTVTNTPTVTANVGTTNGLALDATLTGGNVKIQGNTASGSADSGNPVKAGGVYNSAAPTLSSGQRGDLQLDTNGNLKVNIASGGSSGGATDEGGWTAGITGFTPTGGVFNDSAAALSSGQQGTTRLTNNRGIHTNLRNSAGTEIGTPSNPVEVSLANTAANATAVKVDGSGVTQPVSFSSAITVNALPTGSNTIGGVELVDAGGTNKLAINASGQASVTATGGDLTSGSQTTKITDGTNTANVGVGDSSNGFALTGSGHLTQTFSLTTTGAGTSYDVGNYRWVSVQFTSVGGATSTTTFQTSNDNTTFTSNALVSSGAVAVDATTAATAAAGAGIYHGPIAGRYFRLNVTVLPSGTVAGTIIFSTKASALSAYGVAVSQQSSPWVSSLQPATSGGWSVSSAAPATGLTNTIITAKAAAGQVGGYTFYNPNAAVTYIQIFNVASGSITLGTTAATMIVAIPAASMANVEFANGVAFGTAINYAATASLTANTAPATSLTGFLLFK